MVDVPVLSVLIPFALDTPEIPPYLSATVSPALATIYDGATPVAAGAEEDSKDQAQLESPVKNLRWALQHGRVVDLDIKDAIIAIDPSAYDSLVNLLTKAIESDTNTKRTPIVLSRWSSSLSNSYSPVAQPMLYLPHSTPSCQLLP